jgi:hypothetical protein
VTLEPRFEREAFDGSAAGSLRVTLAIGEHLTHRRREGLRRRRLVALPARRVRNSDPGIVADELDGAPASCIDDREPARHRFDHR